MGRGWKILRCMLEAACTAVKGDSVNWDESVVFISHLVNDNLL